MAEQEVQEWVTLVPLQALGAGTAHRTPVPRVARAAKVKHPQLRRAETLPGLVPCQVVVVVVLSVVAQVALLRADGVVPLVTLEQVEA